MTKPTVESVVAFPDMVYQNIKKEAQVAGSLMTCTGPESSPLNSTQTQIMAFIGFSLSIACTI